MKAPDLARGEAALSDSEVARLLACAEVEPALEGRAAFWREAQLLDALRDETCAAAAIHLRAPEAFWREARRRARRERLERAVRRALRAASAASSIAAAVSFVAAS
ncbi:MAG: hypothetical protein IJS46_01525, partial [Kiritimatiellae bacterium]|nr:hypothetical protein [Kiritimatiellia bacterium]